MDSSPSQTDLQYKSAPSITNLTPHTIFWARLTGYPAWPARLCSAIEKEVIFQSKGKMNQNRTKQYPVVFLGLKCEKSWILEKNMLPFDSKNLSEFFISHKFSKEKSYRSAIAECYHLLCKDRIETWNSLLIQEGKEVTTTNEFRVNGQFIQNKIDFPNEIKELIENCKDKFMDNYHKMLYCTICQGTELSGSTILCGQCNKRRVHWHCYRPTETDQFDMEWLCDPCCLSLGLEKGSLLKPKIEAFSSSSVTVAPPTAPSKPSGNKSSKRLTQSNSSTHPSSNETNVKHDFLDDLDDESPPETHQTSWVPLSSQSVDDLCFICGLSGKLHMCDFPKCTKVYHQICVVKRFPSTMIENELKDFEYGNNSGSSIPSISLLNPRSMNYDLPSPPLSSFHNNYNSSWFCPRHQCISCNALEITAYPLQPQDLPFSSLLDIQSASLTNSLHQKELKRCTRCPFSLCFDCDESLTTNWCKCSNPSALNAEVASMKGQLRNSVRLSNSADPHNTEDSHHPKSSSTKERKDSLFFETKRLSEVLECINCCSLQVSPRLKLAKLLEGAWIRMANTRLAVPFLRPVLPILPFDSNRWSDIIGYDVSLDVHATTTPGLVSSCHNIASQEYSMVNGEVEPPTGAIESDLLVNSQSNPFVQVEPEANVANASDPSESQPVTTQPTQANESDAHDTNELMVLSDAPEMTSQLPASNPSSMDAMDIDENVVSVASNPATDVVPEEPQQGSDSQSPLKKVNKIKKNPYQESLATGMDNELVRSKRKKINKHDPFYQYFDVSVSHPPPIVNVEESPVETLPDPVHTPPTVLSSDESKPRVRQNHQNKTDDIYVYSLPTAATSRQNGGSDKNGKDAIKNGMEDSNKKKLKPNGSNDGLIHDPAVLDEIIKKKKLLAPPSKVVKPMGMVSTCPVSRIEPIKSKETISIGIQCDVDYESFFGTMDISVEPDNSIHQLSIHSYLEETNRTPTSPMQCDLMNVIENIRTLSYSTVQEYLADLNLIRNQIISKMEAYFVPIYQYIVRESQQPSILLNQEDWIRRHPLYLSICSAYDTILGESFTYLNSKEMQILLIEKEMTASTSIWIDDGPANSNPNLGESSQLAKRLRPLDVDIITKLKTKRIGIASTFPSAAHYLAHLLMARLWRWECEKTPGPYHPQDTNLTSLFSNQTITTNPWKHSETRFEIQSRPLSIWSAIINAGAMPQPVFPNRGEASRNPWRIVEEKEDSPVVADDGQDGIRSIIRQLIEDEKQSSQIFSSSSLVPAVEDSVDGLHGVESVPAAPVDDSQDDALEAASMMMVLSTDPSGMREDRPSNHPQYVKDGHVGDEVLTMIQRLQEVTQQALDIQARLVMTNTSSATVHHPETSVPAPMIQDTIDIHSIGPFTELKLANENLKWRLQQSDRLLESCQETIKKLTQRIHNDQHLLLKARREKSR